ncbi:DUF3631 domain-containing protein [Sciscionella marina]|uniref:DUF3631 domain-containing protein n=1 Tax=Sciscionella marina TaxID=508770 RepID=UPI000366C8FE|nr:DUF3631 domain-containing protein [Sciscionella marina]
MPDELDATLAAIDAVTTPTETSPSPAPLCQQCGSGLGDSVSDDFCTEPCQHAWQTARAQRPQPSDGEPTMPDETIPDTDPGSMPWLTGPEATPEAGHDILDELTAFILRFSAFPDQHCAPMLALWYAHTHAADCFYVTPRVILDSAEPGSGKTRVLEIAQHFTAHPEMTISATPAALFRMVSDGPITLLFDEVDTIFNPKNGGNNEDLRALLNAGYKRTATVARCVGDAKAMKVERFPVYAPAVLAGIAGHMPDTITTRAVTIHMRRRNPELEPVEPYDDRAVTAQAQPLRQRLATWIGHHGEYLANARPTMPEGVTDRAAEIWEPLIAIADRAGGHWPDTARAACTHFVAQASGDKGSLGVRLLKDLKWVFTKHGTDRMHTDTILTELHDMEDAPWAELKGKPLDSRGLSRLLGRYEIKPVDVKVSGNNRKGYRTDAGLHDAWSRYLPQSATSATSATPQVNPVADTETLPLPPLPDPDDGSAGSG